MALQSWIIFTPAQAVAAMALNDAPGSGGVAVNPRPIDNPAADELGEGILVGKRVAPARLIDDPEYSRWVEFCSALPIREMDSDALFVPPDEE